MPSETIRFEPNTPIRLKLCPTCGTPHPEQYTTSHHPTPCSPGCFCLQKGDAPEGCIWSVQVLIPPDMPPDQREAYGGREYLKMIIAREEAAKVQREAKKN